MNKQLFTDVTDWQEATFKEIKTMPLLRHLGQETEEVIVSILMNDTDKRLEFADCFILLMGAAKADGMSYEDICSAIKEKLEINKKRTWGEPDSNGVINHVKEEEVMCCANCSKLNITNTNVWWGTIIDFKCTLNPTHPVSIGEPKTYSCTNFKSR